MAGCDGVPEATRTFYWDYEKAQCRELHGEEADWSKILQLPLLFGRNKDILNYLSTTFGIRMLDFLMGDRHMPVRLPRSCDVWCPVHERWEEYNLCEGRYRPKQGSCELQAPVCMSAGSYVFDSFEVGENPEQFLGTGLRKAGRKVKNFACDLFNLPRQRISDIRTERSTPYAWQVFKGETSDAELVLRAAALSIKSCLVTTQKGQLLGERKFYFARETYRISYSLRTGKRCFAREEKGQLKKLAEFQPENFVWFAPPQVIEEALRLGREQAALVYGFQPSLLRAERTLTALEDFVLRPLDMNICSLYELFYELRKVNFPPEDYETRRRNRGLAKFFPRTEPDCFARLCTYLNLPPTPSLRRTYQRNPLVIVLVLVLRKIGITDQNYWQTYYDSPELPYVQLGDMKVALSGNERGKLVTGDNQIAGLELYLRQIKELRPQASLPRALARLAKEDKMLDFSMKADILEMLAQYWDGISDGLRERLGKEGMSRALHDALVQEVMQLKYPVRELNYPEDKFSCCVNGYNFRLVKNTSQLFTAGQQLHNCVATYADRVIGGQVKIVIVDRDGSKCACIELHQDRVIQQAKGPHNARLTGELAEAVICWALDRGLEPLGDDLQMQWLGRGKIAAGGYTCTELAEPAADEPVTDESVTDEPAADEPTADAPAADG